MLAIGIRNQSQYKLKRVLKRWIKSNLIEMKPNWSEQNCIGFNWIELNRIEFIKKLHHLHRSTYKAYKSIRNFSKSGMTTKWVDRAVLVLYLLLGRFKSIMEVKVEEVMYIGMKMPLMLPKVRRPGSRKIEQSIDSLQNGTRITYWNRLQSQRDQI